MMRISNFFKLVIAIGVCELAGVVGSLFTVPAISGWYAGLAKPELTPPGWVFGPVWTTLYALMGVALFLVWKQHSNILEKVRMLRVWKISIAAFFVQLFLNAIWSIIFFGLQNPALALVDIVLLWFAIIWTMVVFYKISKPAAWLLVPYLLWVSFASYLNYSIWQMNPPQEWVACTQDAKLCPDGSYVGRTGPKCEFTACPTPTRIVSLYYYNEELDKDVAGNIACSRNGLTPVKREIPITQTPIQDTINLLLSGRLTTEERSQGIDTEYPLEEFSLKSALLKDGVLTLEFGDLKNKTVGGACRVGILWFQIEATAKQFSKVQEVRFLPEDIFQP